MILTEIFKNVGEINDLENYHVETAMIKSDDLLKSILRVKSDHGNEYGIRLGNRAQPLENGSAFLLNNKKLLVLNVIPDEMIVITPQNIDEMGITAHFLGNLHKPIQVKNGKIQLLFDPVVESVLKKKKMNYETEKISLDKPLQYVDMVDRK